MLKPDPRQEQDLATVLGRRVAYCPDKPWIVTPERQWTYREIDDSSSRLAGGLSSLGIEFGETCLVMLNDTVDYVVAWCALSRAGIIEVPVNVHYRGNLFAYLINDSRAKTMIVDPGFADRLPDIMDGLEYLERLILCPDGYGLDGSLLEVLTARFELLDYSSVFAEPYGGFAPKYNDIAGVFYTSGTTGPSKGVTMVHSHIWEYAYGVTEMLDLRETDVYYAPLPLFHIAGKFAAVYASCLVGGTAVLAGTFSAERFWQDVNSSSVTTTFLLGAMANFLYRQPRMENDDDNTMERVLMVPLIPEVEDFKSRYDCLVSTTWGGTEMNCPTQSTFDLVDNRSCGKVVEDRYEVRIADEEDNECPPGVAGEALVRAKEPWIMTNGYWNHPEWTVKAWRNLWMHTGDMMMKDEEGNLFFVDRTKDAIRRRGENISSMEVENEINSHDAVLESAVIPVASEETEQEVMAVIVLKPGLSLDFEEMIRYLEPRMAYFMVPRYLEVVGELPKTPTGKIQKYVLRERGLGVETWDRVAEEVRLIRG